jgi:protein gp37
MQKTDIEYLDYTWNPIAMRCERISTGCNNCWALKRMKMLARNPYTTTECKLAYCGSGDPVLKEKELGELMKIKFLMPRIGVQFMGDLFHPRVSYNQMNRVIGTCNEHTDKLFYFLTKRAKNMCRHMDVYPEEIKKHMWFGVSVENQMTAENRIPYLVESAFYRRWISVEPMLEEIDISRIPGIGHIGWVVCGMETGPEARPFKVEWVANLLQQCRNLEIPFFFKNANNNELLIPKELKVQEFPKGIK